MLHAGGADTKPGAPTGSLCHPEHRYEEHTLVKIRSGTVSLGALLALAACGGSVTPAGKGGDAIGGAGTGGSSATADDSGVGDSASTDGSGLAGAAGAGGGSAGASGTGGDADATPAEASGGAGGAGGPDGAADLRPLACDQPAQGQEPTPSAGAVAKLVVGAWMNCGPQSMFQTSDEIGIELVADGTWYKLYASGTGDIGRGAGPGKLGTYLVDAGGLGTFAVRLTSEGDVPASNLSFWPTFATSPRKMHVTTPAGGFETDLAIAN
jgi:hypothetical protein